jgi:membrane protein
VLAPVEKFLADRGTHLAAMIAYFALLSLVPLVFLAFALLGFFGQVDAESYLVAELSHLFPSGSIEDVVRVVRGVQRNAAALGLVGAVFLLWTSLSLFSVLESAFNIVYGRPNRSFLHGKALAVVLLISSLVGLFVGLVVGSIGFELLQRYAPGIAGNSVVAYVLSIGVSTLAVFVFLFAVYYLLTNEKLTVRDVLPGAVFATVVLQLTFQVLPLYVRLSRDIVVLQAFGTPVILLVWMYVMANVIVLGAEVNWWLGRRREPGRPEDVPGLA